MSSRRMPRSTVALSNQQGYVEIAWTLVRNATSNANIAAIPQPSQYRTFPSLAAMVSNTVKDSSLAPSGSTWHRRPYQPDQRHQDEGRTNSRKEQSNFMHGHQLSSKS